MQCEVDILESLALRVEKNQSWRAEIERKLKSYAHKTVDNAIDSLFAKRMIIKVKDVKRIRSDNRNDIKPFEISTYGLLTGLFYERLTEAPLIEELRHQREKQKFVRLKTPTLWREIDQVAKRHEEKIPLIFGKWEHFKKHGCLDYVIISMRHFFENNQQLPSMIFQQEDIDVKAVIDPSGNLSFSDLTYEEQVKTQVEALETKVVQALTTAVIFPEPTPPVDYASTSWGSISAWEETLLGDADLKRYIFSEITRRENYCRDELRQLKLWKKLPGRLKQ